MNGRGFTETFPSIYVPSVINRFIFWSLCAYLLYNAIANRKKKQKLTLFHSKRENLQSAILFILSTVAAILTQTNLMKSPFCEYSLL